MNNYFYEKLAEAHRQDLLREAEQRQFLAVEPEQYQRVDKEAVHGLSSFLTRLGMLLSGLRNVLGTRTTSSTADSDVCTCCTD